MPIDRFQGDYRFLSNFYQSPITLDGNVFPTVEHAYQWLKTHDLTFKASILGAEKARDAKKFGGIINQTPELQTPGFFEKRVEVMRRLLVAKFTPGTELARLLVITHPLELIEGNHWHDNFWGVCVCLRCFNGQNHLGKLLMEVRTEVLKAHVAG